MINMKVNGSVHKVDVDPDTPLLWVLRDNLGLTGTKYCCGVGECGACTVHIDGEPVLSCATSAGEVVGKEITTIEGLQGPIAQALFKAWTEGDVPQCGYCQPGQIMTAAAFLASNKNPTEDDINEAMSAVLCRCGSYQDVKHAVQRAAQEVAR